MLFRTLNTKLESLSVAAVTTGYLMGGDEGNKLRKKIKRSISGGEEKLQRSLGQKRHKECCRGLGAVCDEASSVWFYVEYRHSHISMQGRGRGLTSAGGGIQ